MVHKTCDFAIDFLYSVPIMCIKTANLVDANASEEDKIKAMMCQSNHDYDPIQSVLIHLYSQVIKSIQFGFSWIYCFLITQPCLCSYSKKAVGPPPAHYTCYRCGKAGHYIRQCPMLMVTIPHY